VFVIASTTGGTGSGMAIDIAFGIRRLLEDMGLGADHLSLVLASAADRRAPSRQLSQANTYACVRELYHYSRFPDVDPSSSGDRLLGRRLGTLPNTYLVHLGDDLGIEQFENGCQQLAEVLYRATTTRAAAFLDACQAASASAAVTMEPMVRGIGIG